MILAFLGMLDIIVGAILVFASPEFAGASWLFYIMVIMFIKSLYSIGTAFAEGFYLDIMGYIDLLSVLLLLLMFWGIVSGFFFWIGIIVALKGIYSFIMAFISN